MVRSNARNTGNMLLLRFLFIDKQFDTTTAGQSHATSNLTVLVHLACVCSKRPVVLLQLHCVHTTVIIIISLCCHYTAGLSLRFCGSFTVKFFFFQCWCGLKPGFAVVFYTFNSTLQFSFKC